MEQTIDRIRSLVADGSLTKAGIARASGLHANTLRDCDQESWNPTAETVAKLKRFLEQNETIPVLCGIEEIINEARNGRMFVLVDDEDRENEGDLVIPAQMATPDAINFMAMHGRGLICLSLDRKRVDLLGLEPMSRSNRTMYETAFTTSIEAREGVTTGISAADRARTISVAIDSGKGKDDIVTPGHVFPLVARDGGVLVRAGHTEAAVDIARLAGLNPSGVICEIMNEDGSMARLEDLMSFARRHGLKIGTIRDLIEYRRRYDHLVERIAETSFTSDYGGEWKLLTYRNKVDGSASYVLQKGHVVEGQATLARVHTISLLDDILGRAGPKKRILQRAMTRIGENGAGVIVILINSTAAFTGDSAPSASDGDFRNYGIGAQILADLHIEDMVLLTNSHRNVVAIEGYGLNIVGEDPIPE
ncbi:3,4-dihydroxy-2-butanone-4-phosphate synthase [Qipengyuania atrilutea]|uniref:3,4-dihydroxy-2-butanone 4-phosphate synthase n=1 Tax=Qipengyuania atrilutea TaxID=2744473 RepID=A0A850GW47_9SPHN|nr:3,4-dihydroxy-2-butanone-4-phosphate synthase [Actirhodobacter atriluteus]NVD43751.1 3,4-dihydroxy-2-butanone-4-phosphate synthase [Actirhodobacter atriluteus]